MGERVEIILLLMLVLSLYYFRVGSHNSLFVNELPRSCSVEEREALLSFKRSLFDPQHILSNWDIGDDCCTWKGVGCSNTTGHVIKLDLRQGGFHYINYGGDINAASLFPSLFHLKHLQYLSLSGIYFNHTSVPHSIDSLTNLRYLDLSSSGFAGVIPPHLGNLTKLRHLDLSVNDVVIDMSLDVWLFRLKHLQYLSLGQVLFKQKNILQKIVSLNGLRYLDLMDSGIEGVIPPQLSNLTNLYLLDLHYNSLFTSNLLLMSQLFSLQYLDMSNVNLKLATNWLYEISMLPTLSILSLSGCSLQTLPTLLPYINFSSTITYIDLSLNNLNGSFPTWLGQFKRLNSLYFKSNNLIGPISRGSLSLLCNLKILELSENNFTKLIDDGSALRCKKYKMINLFISSNQLTGSIPEWVGQRSQLTWLDLSYNQLSGSIPQSFGQLINLNTLDLSSNLLNGSVSDVNFANLSQLKYLFLSNNHLNFNMISSNWIPPFQAYYIFLSYNIIGPNFPLWLQNQKSIYQLELSNSAISDIIPSWFWNISSDQMTYLNMSHNTIRGEITMLNMSIIAMIDLKSNLLEGHLPQLSNQLLYFATFSNNKFSSGIEWYLNANMSFLTTLDLSQNHLLGEIPDSICQMPSIVLLDISYNNLSGEIPKCKENFSSFMKLRFINLKNNNLWGSIPQWIGNLPMLLSLSLSNNSFHGELPLFKNSTNLITFDMGQNKLTGNIPSWIGDRLVSLKILSLRSNKFKGLIPSELSKLKRLQILDLADNFLSGPLPKSLKFLTAIATQNKSLEPLILNADVMIPDMTLVLHYSFNLTDLVSLAWSDSLLLYIKGRDLKFTGILSLVTIMDLSCNNLTGEVPIELMSLIGLISLNLSRNKFIGQIPINIGVMQSLQSLDLSRNHFSGEIPMSIVNLSELEYLNLSYNQLSGRIPMGTQLDTFQESSYYGNPELCGKPLLKTCEGDEDNIHNRGKNSNVVDDDNFDLFLGMGLGFIVGLWSVLGTLLLKRSLAIAYFQLCDNITNNIYVFVAVKLNQWFNR